MADSDPGASALRLPLPGAPLARVVRGGALESWHRGSLVVVRGGKVALALGDPRQPIWCRSAIKPLQALPLFEHGVVDALQLDDRELAVISASHDGTDAHVAVVDGILRKAGLSREHLGCGPHAPFDREASLAIARAGGKPQRIHNNCSGKHAGFLLLAQALGTPLDRYLDADAAPQRAVREVVASLADVEAGAIEVAVDGCGAPTLRLPLVALARAFWRLTHPFRLPPARRAGCERLLAAVNAHPVLLSGERRLCRALIDSAPGQLYPKNGAEGVYTVGAVGLDLALAVKVDDGQERGYIPAVVQVLRAFGLWPALPPGLAEFARMPVRNTDDLAVGWVESAVELGR